MCWVLAINLNLEMLMVSLFCRILRIFQLFIYLSIFTVLEESAPKYLMSLYNSLLDKEDGSLHSDYILYDDEDEDHAVDWMMSQSNETNLLTPEIGSIDQKVAARRSMLDILKADTIISFKNQSKFCFVFVFVF